MTMTDVATTFTVELSPQQVLDTIYEGIRRQNFSWPTEYSAYWRGPIATYRDVDLLSPGAMIFGGLERPDEIKWGYYQSEEVYNILCDLVHARTQRGIIGPFIIAALRFGLRISPEMMEDFAASLTTWPTT